MTPKRSGPRHPSTSTGGPSSHVLHPQGAQYAPHHADGRRRRRLDVADRTPHAVASRHATRLVHGRLESADLAPVPRCANRFERAHRTASTERRTAWIVRHAQNGASASTRPADEWQASARQRASAIRRFRTRGVGLSGRVTRMPLVADQTAPPRRTDSASPAGRPEDHVVTLHDHRRSSSPTRRDGERYCPVQPTAWPPRSPNSPSWSMAQRSSARPATFVVGVARENVHTPRTSGRTGDTHDRTR